MEEMEMLVSRPTHFQDSEKKRDCSIQLILELTCMKTEILEAAMMVEKTETATMI